VKTGLTFLALARGVFVLGLNRLKPIMKTERTKETGNRREFLRGGARYTLLAGLAVVSALLARKRGAALSGQTCVNNSICRGCNVVGNCGLPQALSFKQATQRRLS
jgi:hypothetical protein